MLSIEAPGEKGEMQQSPSEGSTFIWEYRNAGKPGLTTAGRHIRRRIPVTFASYRKDSIFWPMKESIFYLCYFRDTEFVAQATFATGTANSGLTYCPAPACVLEHHWDCSLKVHPESLNTPWIS